MCCVSVCIMSVCVSVLGLCGLNYEAKYLAFKFYTILCLFFFADDYKKMQAGLIAGLAKELGIIARYIHIYIYTGI